MDNDKPQSENEKIKHLEGRIQELENNWKRAVADYRNLERRTAEEQVAFASFANQILLRELLPVLDALESAVDHLKDEGLGLAVTKFKNILGDFNVREIDVAEKIFDATIMEAIETVDGEENKVVAVTEKGYMIGDRILRPARVKVGKGGI